MVLSVLLVVFVLMPLVLLSLFYDFHIVLDGANVTLLVGVLVLVPPIVNVSLEVVV